MKKFITFSSPFMLQNMCGDVWQNLLALQLDLGIFPSSFGGFLNMCLLIVMFRSLALPLFAAQFGNFEIEFTLKEN
jgi:hypothetical protein